MLSGVYGNVIFHAVRLHVGFYNHVRVCTVYYFARFLTGSFVFNFLKVSVALLLFPSQKALLINQVLPCKQLLSLRPKFTTPRIKRRSLSADLNTTLEQDT